MFDLQGTRQVTDRELTAMLARLDRLSPADWATPTRCAGWTVADLVGHVAVIAEAQAEALDRATRHDTTVAPTPPPPSQSQAVAALRGGRRRLADALAALPAEAMGVMVPLPVGLVPMPAALQILGLEYALHRNDLEWALSNQEPLPGDVTATALEGLPSLLPMMAAGTGVRTPGERPVHPLGYRLQGRSSTLDVAWTGVSWEIGRLCDPVVSVAGDDSSVVLFVAGRLPMTHPGLRVTGDPGLAARFKRWFPGP
jgi:uncharacterized protein (TIGR03083 family)